MIRVKKLVDAILKLSDIEEHLRELHLIADFFETWIIVLASPAIACHFLDQILQGVGLIT